MPGKSKSTHDSEATALATVADAKPTVVRRPEWMGGHDHEATAFAAPEGPKFGSSHDHEGTAFAPVDRGAAGSGRRAPSGGAPQLGELFDGRWRILSELGSGGMGTVFRALDERTRNEVAVKVLAPGVVDHPQALDTLRQEIATSQRVGHPNLLRIFDLRDDAPTPYVVMEYIDGGDLEDFRRGQGGTLADDVAATVADQILAGLSQLHRHGVVHLDLKPGNVLRTRDGQVKLLDYGVAKRLKDLRDGQAVAGTPAFMAPEAADGGDVGPRSDLYSFALMLYVLLAGKLPFDKTDAAATRAWRNQPRKSLEGVSAAWRAVLEPCLALDPAKRLANAEVVREKLAPLIPEAAVADDPKRAQDHAAARKSHEEQEQRAAARAKGELLIVAQDGSGDARQPSEALAKATRGAVIEIERGEYKDFLYITKPVTLRAAKGADVTLTPVGPGHTEYDRLQKKVADLNAERKAVADQVAELATPYREAEASPRSARFEMDPDVTWENLATLGLFLPLVLIAVLVPILARDTVTGFWAAAALFVAALLSAGLSCVAVAFVCFLEVLAFLNDAGRRVTRVGHVVIRAGMIGITSCAPWLAYVAWESLSGFWAVSLTMLLAIPLGLGALLAAYLLVLQLAFRDKVHAQAGATYRSALVALKARAEALGLELSDLGSSDQLRGDSGKTVSTVDARQLIDEPRKWLLNPALAIADFTEAATLENLRFRLTGVHRGLEAGSGKVRFEVTARNCAFETTSHDAVAIVNASQMCDLVLRDCTVTGGESAVVASSGTVSLSKSRIEGLRGDAVVAKGNARVDLSGCTLARGRVGLLVSENSVATVKDTTITRMVGYGVHVKTTAKGSSFHRVVMSDCGAWGFAEDAAAKGNYQSSGLTYSNCADRAMS
jgi:hypothetical protein